MYLASLASGAYCAAHGYLAHDKSLGWGLAWWVFGSFLPGFAPAVAWAKGFGRPVGQKRAGNPDTSR
jgi:hypothetical protein